MQNQQNPYCLAQYIVTKPTSNKEVDFLDVDPILEKLTGKLFVYIVDLVIDKDKLIQLIDQGHPNILLQRLAEKADELCQGKSYSDLLYKQHIVHKVFSSTINALLSAAIKSQPRGATMSFHQMAAFMKDMEEIRNSAKL